MRWKIGLRRSCGNEVRTKLQDMSVVAGATYAKGEPDLWEIKSVMNGVAETRLLTSMLRSKRFKTILIVV